MVWKQLAVAIPIFLVLEFLAYRFGYSRSQNGIRLSVRYHMFGFVAVVMGSFLWICYTWTVNRLNLKPQQRKVFTYLSLAYAIPTCFVFIFSTVLSGYTAEPRLFVTFAWICWASVFLYLSGLFFVWLLMSVIYGTINGLISGRRTLSESQLKENERLRRGSDRLQVLVVVIYTVFMLVWGLLSTMRDPMIREVDVPLHNFPASLNGFRIAQISDMHAGPTIGQSRVARVVDMVNILKPDLIVLTGDILDGDVSKFTEVVGPLAGFQSKHGVYYVTGNHEYIHPGVNEFLDYLRSIGITPLRNERVRIPAAGPDSFDLAGVDDITAGRMGDPGHKMDINKAMAGRDTSRAVVLLSHQPATIHLAAALGVNLQLSGHVHGGQIFPFHFFAYMGNPYFAGFYKHSEFTHIFVSRGAGWFGPPLRIFAPADIGLVTLRAAAE